MESMSKCSNGEGIETQSLAAVIQKVSLKSSDGFVGGHVKLNVGGRFFYTTIDTLTKNGETMLSAMFSGRMEIPVDAEGWVLIDRSGKHFDTILNYLRDGGTPLPSSESEIGELLAEAKYYCIASLVAICEEYLSGRDIPKMRVILLSSSEEWDRLLKASTKPIVRLIVSRTPDAKISSNTNLFNRFALEWNEHFLFVYDMVTSGIISLKWEFYNSRQLFVNIECRINKEFTFPETSIYDGLMKTIRSLKQLNN